jgi:DNA-binding transcriptional ArsR family regulator
VPVDHKSLAALFSVLSHPVRLQILDILLRSDECVCHLEAVLHRPQPYVSQQLAVLRDAGLIVPYKEGLNVFYRLANPALVASILALAGQPGQDNLRARQWVEACVCPKCQAA